MPVLATFLATLSLAWSDLDPAARAGIEAYCLRCHSGERPKAGLALDEALAERVGDRLELWERVARRLRDGDMPPDDAPRPAPDAIARVVEAIERSVAEEGAPPPALRRLNRTEYDNTIRDLFGFDFGVARESFPLDASGGEGFDNAAATLHLSPLLMERYLAAARRIVDQAVLDDAESEHGHSDAGIAMHRRIMVATPSSPQEEFGAAEVILQTFLRRAFRRSPTTEEIESSLDLYRSARDDGAPFAAAVRHALAAALVSPQFLYRVEMAPEQALLPDLTLAARLSYFLWSSMPDDELLDVAEAGLLQIPEVLRSQIDRMLADPRRRSLADDFALQWLDLRGLGQSRVPDPSRFASATPAVLQAMLEEVARFFDAVIERDGGVVDLLSSRDTFVDRELASHYNYPAPANDDWTRVEREPARPGGVVGLGAVLTATSMPRRTSPVLRGKWVLSALLGAPPPPPPADAGDLPESDADHPGATLRQRLERHRAAPECASCHDRMDPLGFALEAFDAVGRSHAPGETIDTSFSFEGHTGDGAGDLVDVLMERRDVVARRLAEQLLGFALGRTLDPRDRAAMAALTQRLAADGYPLRELIRGVVLSESFRRG